MCFKVGIVAEPMAITFFVVRSAGATNAFT